MWEKLSQYEMRWRSTRMAHFSHFNSIPGRTGGLRAPTFLLSVGLIGPFITLPSGFHVTIRTAVIRMNFIIGDDSFENSQADIFSDLE